MKLQAAESDITSLMESPLAHEDSGTESGESGPESDGSLSSDDEREMQQGLSGGNQTVTIHGPTIVVMNNISTTTISRGCSSKQAGYDGV